MIQDPAFPPPSPFGSHHSAAAGPRGEGTGAAPDQPDPPLVGAAPVDPVSAPVGPAAGFVPVRAMEAVLAARVRQIEHFGHTPERDAAQPVEALLLPVTRYFKSTRESIACNAPLETTRRHAVQLAAMVLALIDRLDHEQESRHG